MARVIETELPKMIEAKRCSCIRNLRAYRNLPDTKSPAALKRRKEVIIHYYEFEALKDLAKVMAVKVDGNIMKGLDRLEMSELLHIVFEH